MNVPKPIVAMLDLILSDFLTGDKNGYEIIQDDGIERLMKFRFEMAHEILPLIVVSAWKDNLDKKMDDFRKLRDNNDPTTVDGLTALLMDSRGEGVEEVEKTKLIPVSGDEIKSITIETLKDLGLEKVATYWVYPSDVGEGHSEFRFLLSEGFLHCSLGNNKEGTLFKRLKFEHQLRDLIQVLFIN